MVTLPRSSLVTSGGVLAGHRGVDGHLDERHSAHEHMSTAAANNGLAIPAHRDFKKKLTKN
jgi:hypothetical protein